MDWKIAVGRYGSGRETAQSFIPEQLGILLPTNISLDTHGRNHLYITRAQTRRNMVAAKGYCGGCYSVAIGAMVRLAVRAWCFATIFRRTAVSRLRRGARRSRGPYKTSGVCRIAHSVKHCTCHIHWHRCVKPTLQQAFTSVATR